MPVAGMGDNDQPMGLLHRMAVLMNVYNAVQAMVTSKDMTAWKKDNARQARLVNWVMEMRGTDDGD